MAIRRVMQVLQRAQPRDVFCQKFLILLLRLANGFHPRRPLFEFDLGSGPHPETLRLDFHFHAFGNTRRVVRAGLFLGFIFVHILLRLLQFLNGPNVLATQLLVKFMDSFDELR